MTDKPSVPRRSAGEGSPRERKDGTWENRVTVDGKRRSVYGKTRKEVLDKADDLRRRHKQRQALRTNETVASWLRRWLAEVMAPPHRAWKTHAIKRGHCENHLIPALGHLRLDRVSTMEIRAVLNGLHRDGYAPVTVNHIRATLNAAMNEAVYEELIPRNPVTGIKPMPVPEADDEPLTAEESRRFLEAIRGDRLEALFTVGLVCGLRMGEATGLTWDMIDLTMGEVRVARSLQWQNPERGFVLKGTKSGKERIIVLPHLAREALREHRMRQRREQEQVAEWGNPWKLVFTARSGKPLHETTVNVLLARYLKEAGIEPRRTFRMLRHSTASLLAAQGVPEIEVQALLGHASGKTTRKYYQRAYASGRQRVADTFDMLMKDV
jgi:integrase